jgi:hypothetical protein
MCIERYTKMTSMLLLVIEEKSPQKEIQARYILEIADGNEATQWLSEKGFTAHWENGVVKYWTHAGEFSMSIKVGGADTLYKTTYPLCAHLMTSGLLSNATFMPIGS